MLQVLQTAESNVFWKMNQNLVKLLCELHCHFIYLNCLAFKISDVRRGRQKKYVVETN